MVMAQLEQLEGTHGKARKDGPSPNHICGMLVKYKIIFTNVLLKILSSRSESDFAQREIDFLRYVMINKLVDEQKECQRNPKGELALDSKVLRSLVGLANYYHHFIQDFSKVATIILNLLKKWLSQEWDERCYQTFVELKSKFSS